jgi:hypothetical protein
VPGASRSIKRKDFDDMVAVLPVADPNIFSAAQRIMLAQTQLQIAQSAPQMHNMYEAYYRVYAAMNVRDIDGILRPQHTNIPKDPAQENADLLDMMELKAFAGQQHDAHIFSHLVMGMSPIIQTMPQSVLALQKHILEHVRLKAEEDVEAELFKQYGSDPDRMVSAIQREGMIALKIAEYMQQVRDMQNQLAGGGGPDPIVALKEAEIQQRAQADQADQQIARERLQLDAAKMQQNTAINQQRIQSQENIADLRANVARERANMMAVQQARSNQIQQINARRKPNAA